MVLWNSLLWDTLLTSAILRCCFLQRASELLHCNSIFPWFGWILQSVAYSLGLGEFCKVMCSSVETAQRITCLTNYKKFLLCYNDILKCCIIDSISPLKEWVGTSWFFLVWKVDVQSSLALLFLPLRLYNCSQVFSYPLIFLVIFCFIL